MRISIAEMVERDRPFHDEVRKDGPVSFFGYLRTDAENNPFVVSDAPLRDDGFLEEPESSGNVRGNVPAFLMSHARDVFEYALGFGVDFFLFITMDCRCALTKVPEGWHLVIRVRYANNARCEDFTRAEPLVDREAIVAAVEDWLGRIVTTQGREVGQS